MQQYSLGSTIVKREQQPAVMGSWCDLFTLSRKGSQWTLMFFWTMVVMFSTGTSAAFTEDMAFPTQTVESGQWIPELSVLVDGQKKPEASYALAPCVTLETDIEPVNIYYSWSDEELLEDGAYYTGGCVAFPEEEGEFTVRALAVHDRDNRWQSEEEAIRIVVKLPEEEQERKSDDEKRNRDNEDETDAVAPVVTAPVSEPAPEMSEVPNAESTSSDTQGQAIDAPLDEVLVSETSEEDEVVVEEKEIPESSQSEEDTSEVLSQASLESTETPSDVVE